MLLTCPRALHALPLMRQHAQQQQRQRKQKHTAALNSVHSVHSCNVAPPQLAKAPSDPMRMQACRLRMLTAKSSSMHGEGAMAGCCCRELRRCREYCEGLTDGNEGYEGVVAAAAAACCPLQQDKEREALVLWLLGCCCWRVGVTGQGALGAG